MRLNNTGCALCDSTWGDLYEEVDGERLFFCCDLCTVQFRRIVAEARARLGSAPLEALEIVGDRRGRTCAATAGGRTIRFFVSFNPLGELRRFSVLPSG